MIERPPTSYHESGSAATGVVRPWRTLPVLFVSLVCAILLLPPSAEAVEINSASARKVAAVALKSWFGFEKYGIPDGPQPSIRCQPSGRRIYGCRFRYMPGNTLYEGRLRVSRARKVGPDKVRARVRANVTVTRLPPERHIVRAGTFTARF